jgi:two-component system sensor histidine kinase YesM
VYERQLSEREAELKAIQAQLNPHFLYNTLNGLYWKLYVQNDMETANLVSALSGLLKYSLERVDKHTVLREELRQIRHYLDIQDAFMENRFHAEIEAGDDVLDCKMPRLLLQPIVENAFVHAFRDRTSGKRLTISAERRDGLLRIVTTDNGSGMEPDQIDHILSAASDEERMPIGLRSVIRRIELLYGKPYGLEIESVPGGGTTITLRLPYDPVSDQHTA